MLALGPVRVDSGLVFTSSVGTVIEPRNLTRSFDEMTARAGVRRIRFHDLRHTCASVDAAGSGGAGSGGDGCARALAAGDDDRPLLARDADCAARGGGCDGSRFRSP